MSLARVQAPPIEGPTRRVGRSLPMDGAVAVAAPVGRTALPRVSCVVPCWNEAENLAQLVPLLRDTLNRLGTDWEIVLVDDGSTDDTAAHLADWTAAGGVRVLQLSRNFGKEAALSAGLQAAAGDVVVLLDADLQHPPALIPTLLSHWQRGADVVYAVRAHRHDESALKRWGSRWFYRLVNAADRFELPPDAGDFRLMDRAAVDALLSLPERNRFMKGLYAWVGFDAVAVPYEPPERTRGRSSFTLRRLAGLALDGLTSFTTWPLRAVSIGGFVLAACGMLYGAYEAANFLLFGNAVPGWTTIVVGMLLFLGVQMISLGIIGEYVGRIFEEVKGRPLFIVKRDLGQGLKDPRR